MARNAKPVYKNNLTVLDNFIMTLAFAGICPTDVWSNLNLTSLKAAMATSAPQSAS